MKKTIIALFFALLTLFPTQASAEYLYGFNGAQTLSGSKTLTKNSPTYNILSGADIVLPLVSSCPGKAFIFQTATGSTSTVTRQGSDQIQDQSGTSTSKSLTTIAQTFGVISNGSVWLVFNPGAPGATGATGATGSTGPAGADGNTIIYGTAAPTTEGKNGDLYFRTDTNFIYGPKAAGVWPSGVSLVGPQGVKGDQGDQGIQGIQGVQGLKGDKGDQGDPGSNATVTGTTNRITVTAGVVDIGSKVLTDDSVHTITNKSIAASQLTGSIADARLSSKVVLDDSTNTLTNKTINGSQLVSHSIAPSKIDTTGATTGYVLKFNGTDYAPAADNTSGGGSGGQVDSVVGTTNRIAVDSTDPVNPKVDIGSKVLTDDSVHTLTNKSIAASQLTGTVADARLTSNVPLINAANAWAANQTPNSAGGFALGTSALPWSGIKLGNAATNNTTWAPVVTAARTFSTPDANSNSVVPTTATSHQFVTNIDSSGAQVKAQPAIADLSDASSVVTPSSSNTLTNKSIDASQLTGSVADARLSSNVVTLTGVQTLTNKSIAGSEIDSGTLPDARLSTNVVTLTGAQTLTNKTIGASQLTGAIPSTVTATTQTANNGTTAIATCKYVDDAVAGVSGGGGGGGSALGGDGSDGAVTKGAVTETTPTQYNASTFTQSSSTTYSVKSGTVINAKTSITINGTLTVQTAMPGSTGSSAGNPFNAGNGAGPAGGSGNVANAVGGAGGGNAGKGGDGAPYTASAHLWLKGGKAIALTPGGTGSGGVGAGYTSAADGGAGGGNLRLISAGAITIASGGAVEAKGTAGGNGDAGGGGGSGGDLLLYSLVSITQTGTSSVAGGNGGNGSGYGGGGGGGGGFLLRHSPSNTGAGTITVSGGSAGTSGAGGGTAGAGDTGLSISITGTPNLPLIAEHQRSRQAMVALARAEQAVGHQSAAGVEWNQKSNVSFLAAIKSDSNTFDSVCYELNNGEQPDGHGKACLLFIGDALDMGDAA